MAGEVGIEPTNAGIKIRCLTTWRLPKTLVILRPQRMPLQAPRHKAPHVCRQLCQRLSGLNFTIKRAEDTCPGSGHARIAILLQPLKMTSHLRVTPAHHGFKIIVALAD